MIIPPAMNDDSLTPNGHDVAEKVYEGEILPADTDLSERTAWLDKKLSDYSKSISIDLLAMCPFIEELIADHHYLAFGFERPDDYFQSRLGMSYRSVARIMKIHRTIKLLPDGQQDEARSCLAVIGTHKAGVIAPAIEEVPESWQSWVTVAEMTTEEALQDKVNEALDRPPKAGSGTKSMDGGILNRFPPDLREWGEKVFHAARQVSGANTWVGALIAIMQEAEPGLMQSYAQKKKGALV